MALVECRASGRMPGMDQPLTGVRLRRTKFASSGWPACALLLLLLPCALSNSQVAGQIPGRAAAKPAAKSEAANLVIAPDLSAQLAKFKPVRMPYDSARLAPREQQMVAKLVEASQALESIYWRESDPEGLNVVSQQVVNIEA